MENQTPNPMPTAPEAPMPQEAAPAAQMPVQDPVMPQQAPAAAPASGGSKKMLWIVLIVVILILAGLAAWYFMALNQANNASVTGSATTVQQIATPTPTPTGTQVTPIQKPSDLNGALNQVNGSNSTQTQTQLDQNAADSSSFSQ